MFNEVFCKLWGGGTHPAGLYADKPHGIQWRIKVKPDLHVPHPGKWGALCCHDHNLSLAGQPLHKATKGWNVCSQIYGLLGGASSNLNYWPIACIRKIHKTVFQWPPCWNTRVYVKILTVCTYQWNASTPLLLGSRLGLVHLLTTSHIRRGSASSIQSNGKLAKILGPRGGEFVSP